MKNTSKLAWPPAGLLLFALLGSSWVAPLAAAEAPGAQIAGHWLAVDYMKALEKTRSPLAASNESSLVALLVDPSPEGYRFSVTSFHEGLNYLIQGFEQKAGRATILADSFDDDTDAAQQLELELLPAEGGERLAAGTLWGEDRVVYRRLPGTVAEYVNGLVIAGEYRDEKGKPYTFEKSGAATWAGQKLSYEIIIDTYEADCDYFSRTDPAEPDSVIYIGFRRQDGNIALYDLVEDSERPLACAKKPFLVLTKKS